MAKKLVRAGEDVHFQDMVMAVPYTALDSALKCGMIQAETQPDQTTPFVVVGGWDTWYALQNECALIDTGAVYQ